MTSKKEWEEYFELVNGHKPSIEETQKALANGEFSNKQTNVTETAKESVNNSADQNDHSETAVAKEQATEAYQKIKEHTGNYFGWWWVRTIHPTKYVEESNPNKLYLWLTIAFATILTAASFWNIARRAAAAVASAAGVFGGQVSSSTSSLVSSIFLLSLLVFATLFLSAIPALALTTLHQLTFKDMVLKYLALAPTAAFFAALTFVYSFIVQTPSLGSNFLISAVQAFGPLLLLPLLSVIVFSFSAYYLVQETRKNNKKIDLIWWQLLQLVLTFIVIAVVFVVIIQPMAQSTASSVL